MHRTRILFCLFLSMLALAGTSAAQHDRSLVVNLPEGETPLDRIGLYRVAYQSYGDEVVRMPLSWSGHFESESGISYQPGRRVNGRDAILLHSPWHVPAGKMWVDYRLRLPDAKPITLNFGIAMGPRYAGKSDGVTFSAYVLDDGEKQELMRRHYKKAEWVDYDFDLSEHAGSEVTVRLQVEPGPKNSSAWDYSYFGNPRIVAGERKRDVDGRLQSFTSSRAYRATRNVDLSNVLNDRDRGVAPSNLLGDYTNEAREEDGAYLLSYAGDDCRLTYRYEPRTGTLNDWTVRQNDSQAFWPALGGGVILNGSESGRSTPARGELQNLDLNRESNTLTAEFVYDVDGQPVPVEWTFGITAKALTVSVRCEKPVATHFSLGRPGAGLRHGFNVPYLPGNINYLPEHKLFTGRRLDWTRSNSSLCPRGEATYHEKTDGTRNTLRESGYVAVSPSALEVLPNIPHPQSPYRETLAPLMVLDMWPHHRNSYSGDAELLRRLKDNGVDHVGIILHNWQRYGYDVKLPDHFPANPRFGGHEQMKKLGQTAKELGYLFSLHENYIDLYPDAPSYDSEAQALKPDGSPQLAWFNEGTQVQSFGLSPNYAVGFARENSPKIHRSYETTAAYLDVSTCTAPWVHLDHDAEEPLAAMGRRGVKYNRALFQYMRDVHGGPLFGEGGSHVYWAGLCDAVEAEPRTHADREHHTPWPEFNLLKIHPQMLNHGMGYYQRWFAGGRDEFGWGTTFGTPRQMDNYRAQEIAYGHAGFVSHNRIFDVKWTAREHHMLHAIQRLYGASAVKNIDYEIDGQYVSPSAALAVDRRERQRITYESGLKIWLNWGENPWTVNGHHVPRYGFLALGPNTEAWTAKADGKYADYAECPEYVFADARTTFDVPYIDSLIRIEPKLTHFEHLGGNRVKLSYQWDVNEELEKDYNCYVHFCDPEDSSIIFQQDHGLPRPTSSWQKGQTIADGPFEISIPEDGLSTYDILIGLHGHGRGRLHLEGVLKGDRVLVGHLNVERENGKVTDVSFSGVRDGERENQKSASDFAQRLNPEGTRIDFGKVATDGAVKVEKRERSLTVFPYPRETDFTVELNLTALAPQAEPEEVEVRALAAESRDEMGTIDHEQNGDRVTFQAGHPGAGRYVISW